MEQYDSGVMSSATSARNSAIVGDGRPSFYALEPRILLDAAALATAAETVADDNADAAESETSADPESSATTDEVVAALALLDPPADRTEVVFVDLSVSDYQTLISGVASGIEVVVLSADRDGVVQIAEYLHGRADIDAIQIISHGDVGEVRLGDTVLDAANLDAYTDALAKIGASLTETGDILLYGCRVGADGAGQAFIDSIAALTGADIAASDDLTGSSALGGDWVLEASTGTIEAANAIGGDTLEAYNHVLAAPVAGFGSALDFDGIGSIVRVTDTTASALDLTSNFTIEAWIKPDSVSTGVAEDIVGKSGAYAFKVLDTGLQFVNGNATLTTSSVTLSVGTWQHVAMVFDSSLDASFYVNGTFVETVLGSGATTSNDTSLDIGAANGTTEYFDGQIDEVRIC